MSPSPPRLKALLALAAAALLWERLWPRLWPAAAVAGTFLAVAWLDVLPILPSWLHAAVLVLAAAALGTALWWARSGFRPAGRAAAQRRLERDSGLADRPLAAHGDRLASGVADPMAEALWQRHRAQMAAKLGQLRLGWPRTGIDRVEPWGIRAGVVLLLTVALAAGWRDPGQRLIRALDPGLGFAASQPPLVEVWISPPAYTRAAPLFLSQSAGAASPAAIVAPAGSGVLARVSGTGGEPALLLGGDRVPFAALDDKASPGRAFGAEAVLSGGDRLAVVNGRRTLAEWPMRIIADRPPAIELTAPPAASGNGGLALSFAAADDYGVRAATAVIRRADDPAGEKGEIRLDLPLAAADPARVSGEVREDLSAHRWAGEAVNLELLARDDAGQTGASAAVTFVLPEREFRHAVARAIVAARKRLDSNDPLTRRTVAAEVETIAADPPAFGGDNVVTLALAVARARLLHDDGAGAIDSVRDLLWSTAQRLDEGEVPAAERALAEAQRTLSEALARDAPLAEIERRMDELQAALERYLQALATEMARRGEMPPDIDPRLLPMPSTDLQEMMDAMRQMMRTGARDSAERMLAELQRMLDQLRAGLPLTGTSAAMAEAEALLESLRRLRDRQQGLLDDTFQQLRTQRDRLDHPSRGQPPATEKPGAEKPGAGTEAQQQLRRELAQLMGRAQQMLGNAAGAVPGELGEADQAMRSAGRALEQNRLGDGASRQGQAVDALGRALDALSQSLANALGNSMGPGGMIITGPGARPGRGQGDAFGRNPPGGRRGEAVGNVPIPDAASLRRAGEILKELRRRAGEPERPAIERDYIDRMLRRY